MQRGRSFLVVSLFVVIAIAVAGCQRAMHCPDGQCGMSAYDSYSDPQASYRSAPPVGRPVHRAAPAADPYVSRPSHSPSPSYGGSGTR